MAYHIENKEKFAMSLDEYVDFVRSNVDLRDKDSMMEGACALARFALSKDELMKSTNRCLGYNALTRDSTAQSMNVYQGHGFMIRYNIWLPDLPRSESSQLDNGGMIVPLHDHYFDFVTCGVVGPGYENDLYKLSSSNHIPCVGETAAVEYLDTFNVGERSLMYWVAGEDAHAVRPPSSVSVTVNLIVPRFLDRPGVTSYIDPETSLVDAITGNKSILQHRDAAIAMSAKYGGAGAIDAIHKVARSDSFHGLTRITAVNHLKDIMNDLDFEKLLVSLSDDDDIYLRPYVMSLLS